MPIYLPMNHAPSPAIRIPEEQLSNLATTLDADVSVESERSTQSPTTIIFSSRVWNSRLSFGNCTQTSLPGGASVWVNLRGPQASDANSDDRQPEHSCSADHILNWPGQERTEETFYFEGKAYNIVLSYTTSSSGTPTLSISAVEPSNSSSEWSSDESSDE